MDVKARNGAPSVEWRYVVRSDDTRRRIEDDAYWRPSCSSARSRRRPASPRPGRRSPRLARASDPPDHLPRGRRGGRGRHRRQSSLRSWPGFDSFRTTQMITPINQSSAIGKRTIVGNDTPLRGDRLPRSAPRVSPGDELAVGRAPSRSRASCDRMSTIAAPGGSASPGAKRRIRRAAVTKSWSSVGGIEAQRVNCDDGHARSVH